MVKAEIENVIGLDAHDAAMISAKTGLGVPDVLEEIVKRIPPPPDYSDRPLKALVYDSHFDSYKGIIAYVRIHEGSVKVGDQIRMMATGKSFEVTEVGFFAPQMTPTQELSCGTVGYLAASIKNVHDCRVGDTITTVENGAAEPLPGYRKATPMVYCGLYPVDSKDYGNLRDALDKLHLNDAALVYEAETSLALGFGFRCGFLGLLHIEEPFVKANIMLPSDLVGAVMELAQERRGEYLTMTYIDETRVALEYDLPLNEIIYDFFDKLKSGTRGYASLDYELSGYRPADMVKLDILLNGDLVDALSTIVHRSSAPSRGRALALKLKDIIPRQMFEIPIQAAIGNKIIARETVKAMRKDVLSKCYGGDITRKRKLLEKQKEGKKRMKQVGSVTIPQEAFMAILKDD